MTEGTPAVKVGWDGEQWVAKRGEVTRELATVGADGIVAPQTMAEFV